MSDHTFIKIKTLQMERIASKEGKNTAILDHINLCIVPNIKALGTAFYDCIIAND